MDLDFGIWNVELAAQAANEVFGELLFLNCV